MSKHQELSPELLARMEKENENASYAKLAFDNNKSLRRRPEEDRASIWRTAFMRDIDKITYCPFFSRYSDKTQVFSLYKNDDLTRRNLHVQMVSRIARTIGSALHLNLDLIEAIALGHDMGHPAFAHTGERYLCELSYENSGRYFFHNIQSVQVLDKIFPLNLSIQTLHDIAAHNGEIELHEYVPEPISSFEEFDRKMERCTTDAEYASKIIPCTLEGAVVRISDIIAYLGRDRQDAICANAAHPDDFAEGEIGSLNGEIINNLVVNVIESSYGKPYIKLDDKHFQALSQIKAENYAKIYNRAAANSRLDLTVKPMMWEMYGQLLEDYKNDRKYSPIFKSHIDYINGSRYAREIPYGQGMDPNQIVVDFIASMTDDYFIELHRYMFPDSSYPVVYKGYFDNKTYESEKNNV